MYSVLSQNNEYFYNNFKILALSLSFILGTYIVRIYLLEKKYQKPKIIQILPIGEIIETNKKPNWMRKSKLFVYSILYLVGLTLIFLALNFLSIVPTIVIYIILMHIGTNKIKDRYTDFNNIRICKNILSNIL